MSPLVVVGPSGGLWLLVKDDPEGTSWVSLESGHMRESEWSVAEVLEMGYMPVEYIERYVDKEKEGK